MATKIQWTDETANWITGCEKISPGCLHCYAEAASGTGRLQQFPQYQNVVNGKGHWNGNIEFVPKVLDDLLKGKRKRRVFAPSMSDPFHPNVKDEWRDKFFAVVALTPHIQYQVLTKRPERMYEYFSKPCLLERWAVQINIFRWDERRRENRFDFPVSQIPLPNLHLGVSVENQAAADERIPWLLQTSAVIRFLSVEPLLSSLHLNWLEINPNSHGEPEYILDCLGGKYGQPSRWHAPTVAKIDQIIVGGESGKASRSFNLDWARSLRDQCQSAGVKYFFKQAGSNVWDGDRKLKLRDRKGGAMEEWPEDLRIREVL